MKRWLLLVCALGACHSVEENLGFSAVGSTRWAITVGGREDDRAMDVAFDSQGDVIAVGDFTGPADFGSGLDNVGGPWGFITKRVASDGAERWTVRLLGSNVESHVQVTAVAVSPQDEVVVTGNYIGTVDFGGTTLSLDEPSPPDHGDLFVAKYASDGSLIWVHGLAEQSNATGKALAIAPDGTIYVAGAFMRGSLVLDGEIYQEKDGEYDGLLMAFDAGGARQWVRVFQGTGTQYVESIALAANGDVLTAGTLSGPASFGGAVVEPQARTRTFVTRHRSDGTYLAARAVGPTAPFVSAGASLAIDALDRIVVQDVEQDDSALGPQPVTLRVLDDTFVELWSTPIANHGSYSPEVRALMTTPNGLIASSAWADGQSGGNMEVVAFDMDGASSTSTFGTRVSGGPSQTLTWRTAVDADGAVAFVGQLGGMVDFGTGAIASRGEGDFEAYIVVAQAPAPN